ncbi:metal ABC transporter solute-binding protein, Zn/Mn family [Cutibacterium sp.]|uniref:metal ABC transporter solute-binding protein, Zn/Mn family n=1 Tax=Cutibacterium sp. TaxID=1912221 RepID=UPI0026DB6F13|nr:zinc ABC transporter substrate-binding protein [Cutibacterium sp.]MDO4411522.1 zinc ABC transporter substrate-binding protein [Cutibacterium sp.]
MHRRLLAIAAISACALGMAGCSGNSDSGSSASGASSAAATDKVDIVASTNVWGSVAQSIGGDKVNVHSVISNPDQDPHDYEATAKDKLAFSKAKIAIANGGGYDDWAPKLVESTGSKATLVDAVETSGLKKPGQEEFNEHVFFSIDSARKVAKVVESNLVKVSPDNKATFESNLKDFESTLDDLKDRAAKVGEKHPNSTAIATEPVVGYLLDDMKIKNITPEEFVEQSETEAGPSTKVVHETTTLIADKKASVLLVNGQTSDAVTKELQKAAKSAGIQQVGVWETFPEGVDTYQGFIDKAITDIDKGLA